jgi:hypothetical protein
MVCVCVYLSMAVWFKPCGYLSIEVLVVLAMERLIANPMIGICDIQLSFAEFWAVTGKRDLTIVLKEIELSGATWKSGAKATTQIGCNKRFDRDITEIGCERLVERDR